MFSRHVLGVARNIRPILALTTASEMNLWEASCSRRLGVNSVCCTDSSGKAANQNAKFLLTWNITTT